MPDYEVSEQAAITAKEALETAVRDYYRVCEPDTIATGWVLVAHKMSAEMDSEGTSSVGTLVPTGQVFPMTRGLLDVGLEGSRASVMGDGDE